jgi:hypothetical protein
MLQRGEQPAELGKMGAAVGFKHIDFGRAPGKRSLQVERRRNGAMMSVANLPASASTASTTSDEGSVLLLLSRP